MGNASNLIQSKFKMINKYVPIPDNEVKKIWEEIQSCHKKYLKKYGIKLPTYNTCKAFQLIYLYKYKNCFVHKDVIADFVIAHKSLIKDKGINPKKDQQVRHLGSQQGFNVTVKGEEVDGIKTPSGYHMLINFTEPNKKFLYEKEKREKTLSAKDFEDIKEAYGHCCATCGAKEGTVHRYTQKIVVLTQGHKNPAKKLSLDNIIPQCEYCNQNVYKNDYVFTDEGTINYIYNPEVVNKSPVEIRKKMFEILSKEFHSDT